MVLQPETLRPDARPTPARHSVRSRGGRRPDRRRPIRAPDAPSAPRFRRSDRRSRRPRSRRPANSAQRRYTSRLDASGCAGSPISMRRPAQTLLDRCAPGRRRCAAPGRRRRPASPDSSSPNRACADQSEPPRQLRVVAEFRMHVERQVIGKQVDVLHQQPFQPPVLLARPRAHLRRARNSRDAPGSHRRSAATAASISARLAVTPVTSVAICGRPSTCKPFGQ